MKDPDTVELITRSLRGELAPGEREEFERRFRADPAFAREWEMEQSLENALGCLPDAPVSSNFTHLVMQAALKPEPGPRVKRSWFSMTLAKLAAGVAALAVIGVTLFQQHETAQRRELAEAVNTLNQVASVVGSDQVPTMEVFENFEAIQRLSLPAESEMDMELLLALQK